jgi:hypothetical protein
MALTWQQHQQNIFAGESGGDYDALFGYQNRPDGIFSGIKVSEMPIADVIKFTSPTGAYGQYVKGQVGRVATPVGAYQVVGSTLRGAVEALGLDPSQKFDKATQDKIGQYILKTQGTGAWEGYGKGGAAMAQEPQKPQGLLGGLLGGQGIGGALGMSDDFRDKLKMAILAGTGDARMDPLIRATAARMEKRRGEAKELKSTNKTLEYLKTRADAGDSLARAYHDAVATGTIKGGAAVANYLKDSQTSPKTYQYQALAKDLLEKGLAKNETEALQMALSQTKAGTTVNVGPQGIDHGKPPTDMAWKRNQDGTVALDERGVPIALPIAGTKLANEALKKDETAEVSAEQQVVSGGVVLGNIQEIREVMENSTLPTTGVFGQVLRNIGGTGALDVKKLLDPIEAAIGFERLQAMRDASPTGGALGQVTERELTLLSSALGSLDQAQSREQFLSRLANIESRYTDIIRKFDAYPPDAMAKAGYQPRLGGGSDQAQPRTDDDLLKKYGG